MSGWTITRPYAVCDRKSYAEHVDIYTRGGLATCSRSLQRSSDFLKVLLTFPHCTQLMRNNVNDHNSRNVYLFASKSKFTQVDSTRLSSAHQREQNNTYLNQLKEYCK